MDFLINLKNLLSGMKPFDLEEAFREKRFSPRLKSEVQGTCIIDEREEFSVIISEIGLFGLRIHIGKELKNGDIVRISAIKGIGSLSGAQYTVSSLIMKVLWCKKRKTTREYMAGLQYQDSKKNMRDSWVAYLLRKFGVAVGVSTQKRKRVRIPANLPLVLKSQAEGKEGNGAVIDMGLGGMLISSERAIPRNALFNFSIGPYKALAPLRMTGKIIHERFVPSSGRWVAGVIYERPDDMQQKLLESYLTHLHKEKSP
ncbi:MAG: PilZ domain-containing protein [Candidatus Eremiobacteraeota bacterium]|nr:PilZ domain-containing protein [Candidatus Eremiobacteraeota bacterium]